MHALRFISVAFGLACAVALAVPAVAHAHGSVDHSAVTDHVGEWIIAGLILFAGVIYLVRARSRQRPFEDFRDDLEDQPLTLRSPADRG